jgi:O-antigen/teichoic acid export membrane protein
MLSVTLIGFPVLAACIVVAEPLFVVMYGRKWLPAVVPFQLLCAGGMLKLLNNYASQANEATGNLWPQVRWQAVGMVLVVIGAAIGSSWGGVPGAALGVLGALVVWTLSMQSLVRRATGLTWGSLARPQVPGIVCAALLALVLLGIEAVMTGIRPQAPEWQLLLVQGVGGAIFYAVFLLFAPIAMVRELVRETLNDMLPAGTVQALTWRRKAVPPA